MLSTMEPSRSIPLQAASPRTNMAHEQVPLKASFPMNTTMPLKNTHQSSEEAQAHVENPPSRSSNGEEWVQVADPNPSPIFHPALGRPWRPTGLESDDEHSSNDIDDALNLAQSTCVSNERPATQSAPFMPWTSHQDIQFPPSDTLKILTRQFKYPRFNLWGRKEDSPIDKELLADENCDICTGKGYVAVNLNCVQLCKCVKEQKQAMLTKQKLISDIQWLRKQVWK
jgi:hypothetical protein